MQLPTLQDLDVNGKTVLVRLDLNVPMQAGRVTDDARIKRAIPTLQKLIEKHAKVVILSHLGRPGGKVDLSQSLAPLVDVLSEALWDRPVGFVPDCVGSSARLAVENASPGDILLMENLRFHPEEEAGDAEFAQKIAALGDVFINDAFSCSHRAHASIVGLNAHLPSAAGMLMQEEVQTLHTLFDEPERPFTAVVGGAKVSTKLDLLNNLVKKVDKLIIGGAMANTFLHALGFNMGSSLCETDLADTARTILETAKESDCEILLPEDAAVTRQFRAHASGEIVPVNAIPAGGMMLDVGPLTVMALSNALMQSKTVVWNGPVGAFETAPFDSSTVQLARLVAGLTKAGKIKSVAGGGDTVAAFNHAGLTKQLSYVSTAGGAFLEWLEGKELPGVAALLDSKAIAA